MVSTLTAASRDGTFTTKLPTYKRRPRPLVIDDLPAPVDRGGTGAFFHVVNRRYEWAIPLVTSNRGLLPSSAPTANQSRS